jgi:integral membrane protein
MSIASPAPDRRAPQPQFRKSLLVYRGLAFATGVVLLVATVALIVQVSGHESIKSGVGIIWLFHGYLYLAYVIATFNLGLRMRWNLVRVALVALAGTIPTMSFVAEHYVTRYVRARLAGTGADPARATP